MAKAILNIGTATVDMAIFEEYQKKAMQCLHDAAHMTSQAKEFATDFKEHVEAVAKTTGLTKKEITAFWKARFEESLPKDEDKKKGTKTVIQMGELFQSLNDGLEGSK